MSETKHTPRPWKLGKRGIVIGGPGFATAICHLDSMHGKFCPDKEMASANVDLIVSAPEMVEKIVELENLLGAREATIAVQAGEIDVLKGRLRRFMRPRGSIRSLANKTS